jgi:RNA-splicing ligase RtcB
MMSRSQAKKEVHGNLLRRDLDERGIQIRAGSLMGSPRKRIKRV